MESDPAQESAEEYLERIQAAWAAFGISAQEAANHFADGIARAVRSFQDAHPELFDAGGSPCDREGD